MKILVTGGNGFIGSHLCELLVNSGHDVTSLDIKFDSNSQNINCKKVTVDIVNDDSLLFNLLTVGAVLNTN